MSVKRVFLVLLAVLLQPLAAWAEQQLVLRPEGLFVNGQLVLDGRSEASLYVLRKALPQFTVTIDEYWAEGDRYFRYVVTYRGEKMLQVDPYGNRVSRIDAFSPRVRDVNGVRPGMTFAQLRRRVPVRCGVSEEGGAFLLCTDERHWTLTYVFINPDPAGGGGDPAPGARLDHISVSFSSGEGD